MKNLFILCLLMSIIGGIAAETSENPSANDLVMQVGYWMLSIAGASMLVWLITRFLYSNSKSPKGKA